MKKQIFKIIAFMIPIVFAFFFMTSPVLARQLTDAKGNIDCNGVAGVFQTLIELLAVLAGIAFFIMIIASGVMILTSAGNPEGVQRGQQTLLWGVVGTLISVGLVFVTSTVAEDILGADTTDIFNLQKWICQGF